MKQIDFNGNFEYFNLSHEVAIGVASNYYLSQNYPNPFNPVTKIDFELPYDSKVIIKIFDITGKESGIIIDEFRTAGFYTQHFDASDKPSGVYFYEINATGIDNGIEKKFNDIKKMVVIK